MEFIKKIFSDQQEKRWIWSTSSAKERKILLKKLKNAIITNREAIKEALYKDFKKPYAESELTEIHTCIDEINFAIKNVSKWMRTKSVKTPMVLWGSKSYLQYEAKGVVLILAPWNYPFALLVNPLVAAIAAGNCVIAKPSEKTPATAKILEEIINSVFPHNVAKVVNGDLSVAEALLEMPFDHIFFTGSTAVGKKIMAAASKNLTPVTLELGGKSPVIIDSDVDLNDCVKKLVWGKFLNGGQTCVAPDYIFLPEELKNDFIQLFKMQVEKSFGETSVERLESKDLARIIDQKSFERLFDKMRNEKSLFADAPLSSDHFIPPTLLTDVDLNSPVMEDEIFGPILPLLTYKNVNQAITYIRNQPKPLALYIFSTSKKFIRDVLHKTTSGGVAINHVVLHLANPYLPFGGVGHSGIGSYHGEFGFRTFSHEKAVLHQGKWSLSALYFPPYNSFLSKLAFRLLKWLE